MPRVSRTRNYDGRMKIHVAGRVSAIAAVMVAAGAILASVLNWLAVIADLPLDMFSLFLTDPIGFPVLARFDPLAWAVTLVSLVVIVGGTWIFVALVARASAPGRAAAVFFGTWGAIIIAAWIAGVVRLPLLLALWRIPLDMTEFFVSQARGSVNGTILWALTWGWVAALVVALVHKSATRHAAAGVDARSGVPATASGSGQSGSGGYPAAPPQAGTGAPPHVGFPPTV